MDINDDEHAVSVLIHGPDKPNIYDNLPTIKLNPDPTTACGESLLWDSTITSVYSWYMQPTYTPAQRSAFKNLVFHSSLSLGLHYSLQYNLYIIFLDPREIYP